MSTPTVEQPAATQTSPAAVDALAVAQQHQAAQTALTVAAVAAILSLWRKGDQNDFFGSWWQGGLGQKIFVLLSMAQETVAGEATDFVQEALSVANHEIVVPDVNPGNFVGIASDGRDLERLLAGAPITAVQRVRRGATPAEAAAAGATYLQSVVETQIHDAGRAADQVALAVAAPVNPRKHYAFGYIRVLVLPSCSRCIVLAGRFYKWNAGFQRHYNCDCRHVPVAQADIDPKLLDPKKAFDSMSTAEQDDVFGSKNAETIRMGGDVSRVVNAVTRGKVFVADDGRQGTYVGTGRRSRGTFRPTPWQIFRDSAGDRDKARRDLLRFGYILS